MDNSDKQNAKFLGNVKEPEYDAKTPWSVKHNQHTASFEAYDKEGGWRGDFASMEDANRAVSCVNFCNGFRNEQLEYSSLSNQLKKISELSGELGKAWGNQISTPMDLATDRDLALLVLNDLIFASRTSGGTSGPDEGLIKACEAAEIAFNKINSAVRFIGTENGIADIETPPSDN